MKSWIFIVVTIAVLLGALGWCAQATADGGPALLEPPPVSMESRGSVTALFALFLAFWIAAIAALAAAEPPDTAARD